MGVRGRVLSTAKILVTRTALKDGVADVGVLVGVSFISGMYGRGGVHAVYTLITQTTPKRAWKVWVSCREYGSDGVHTFSTLMTQMIPKPAWRAWASW